jgi:mono/diheme cytochrome c family protein
MNLVGRMTRFLLSAVFAMIAVPLPEVSASPGGDYTREQAQIGAQIYSGSCSVCHGSRLQEAPRQR